MLELCGRGIKDIVLLASSDNSKKMIKERK